MVYMKNSDLRKMRELVKLKLRYKEMTMKVQEQRQWICYLMIAILFLSGMCVELPHADAYFLRVKETSVTGMAGSVISDGTRITSIEKVCTLDTFRNGVITYLSNSRGRILVRRFLRNVVALLAVVILLSMLFYAEDNAGTVFGRLESSHVIIVRYIQQMDGKK